MSWIKRVPKPHTCYRPRRTAWRRWVGSEWQCRKCKTIWIVKNVNSGWDDEYLWERKK